MWKANHVDQSQRWLVIMMNCAWMVSIMRKKSVLQLALQLNFWVANNTCNTLYLYTVGANRQVAWVVKLQLVVYGVQLTVTQ